MLTKQQIRDAHKEWFMYATDWSTALDTAGGTTPQTVTISSDAWFQVNSIQIAVRQGNANAELIVLTWAGTVLLLNTGTGSQFSNVPIAVDSLRGEGNRPHYLEPPVLLGAKSSVLITWTTNVTTRTQAAIVFEGLKLTLNPSN
jgi:hypothetical protein